MESLRLYLERVNTFIGVSTFGRVFRLEGCGHVSFAFPRQTHLPLTNVGESNQELKVHHRDPCRFDDILHHGLRHICQCASPYI